MSDELEQIRQGIDAVDTELVALLNRRAEYSVQVGAYKAKTGGAIFRPGREKALLEKLQSMSHGPLPKEHLLNIYREILSSSRALQRPMRIAYLGPAGTFSHMASREFFGDSHTFMAVPHFADIFMAVTNGDCEYGVIPIENSLYGTVGQNLDLFAVHDVHVQAEWFSRIRLTLMSKETALADITTVYSHSQPLGQCAGWLRTHLPWAKQISLESTAEAAHRAAQEKGSAAIGHFDLAASLGMQVLAQHVEDVSDNWTRFFVLGAQPVMVDKSNKSSIVFSLADKPGCLAAVLNTFASSGVNMSKLESRPMRGERWKYIFFADLDCCLLDDAHTAVLEEVQKHCFSVRVLGAYLAGEHVQSIV